MPSIQGEPSMHFQEDDIRRLKSAHIGQIENIAYTNVELQS